MHVLINAASANMGGALTYLTNLARWLPEVAPGDRFTAFAPADSIAIVRRALGDRGAGPGLDLRPYPYAATGGLLRNVFDQLTLPRLLRSLEADVLFSSTGFGTFVSPRPQALLVRNAAYFSTDFQARYRTLGRSLRKNTLRRWLSLASMATADVTVFPSAGIRDLVGHYRAPARRQVIHYGFDADRFFAPPPGAPPPIAARMQQWRAEGYRVLLSVSTYAVHKNFETLVAALPPLRAAGHRVKLVTTTSRERTTDTAEYDALHEQARALGVDDVWVESGYVPHDQLHALYAAADLYVFPSFTESFGHSLVEAMASGVPVVASDMAVNRELCGDAGRYFATYDPAACAEAIGHVLGSADERRRLAAAGQARAQHFSWRRYAEQLVDVFRALAQERRA